MESRTDIEKNLLVFSLLATQCELYGYALKGNVNVQFAHKLEKYLKSSKDLMNFINKHIDSDVLEDNSEAITTYIETLILTT
jgi:hypothetical protein